MKAVAAAFNQAKVLLGAFSVIILQLEPNCLTWLERYCWPGSRRAEKIFARLDVDDNGELDENEFVRGCLDDTEFIKLLSGDSTAESEDPSNSGNTFEYDDNVPKLDLWLI